MAAGERLKDLRNYFSHYLHAPDCLIFNQNATIRLIMENAYEKSLFEALKKQQEDISIEFPELFEEEGKITSAGVVFFVSFFIERRFLYRLMGYVQGFKRKEGEYNITRDVFSTYCLRDSYSVRTQENDAVMFRDILGYLSRIPNERYQRIKQPATRNDVKLSERKTDKFILFALKYLEDYGLRDLADYTACFARSKIKMEQKNTQETDGNKNKFQRDKPRVEIHFNKEKQDQFYIKRNNVILKVQKKGGQSNVFRMGVYELKYLVLLSLLGKAEEAIQRIDRYISSLKKQLPYLDKISSEEIQKSMNFLPRFVRSKLGILKVDDEQRLKTRLEYIKAKWTDKKEGSRELELHRKGRDILRYINERCDRPLSRKEYNNILKLIVNKDFGGFYSELEELKRTRRLDKNIIQKLSGHTTLNALHERVCDLVLQELGSLQSENLKEYIGLIPKEEKEVTFREKVDRILEQPVVYKGFLRYEFFKEDKKSFARLVEEAIKTKWSDFDIPLGEEYYNIPSLDRFDRTNKKLYETLAMDRICLMMARQYYLRLNKKLAEKAQHIYWKKEDGREVIIFKFQNLKEPKQSFSIRFSILDYTKMYVMDNPEFLCRLWEYFIPKEAKEIDYHKHYAMAFDKYTNLQKEGIDAILRLEGRIIERRKIKPAKNYIEFQEIMNRSGYNNDQQVALKRVRNALLHYNLNFEREHLKRFYGVVKREGIEKKWSLIV